MRSSRRVLGVRLTFLTELRRGLYQRQALQDMQVVWEGFQAFTCSENYQPGRLAAREAAPLLALLDRCRTQAPAVAPQLVLVDGCGLLHPRAAGLACHIGVRGGVAAIGCAKTLLAHDCLPSEAVVRQRVAAALLQNGGAAGQLDLVGQSGVRWGAAVYGHGACSRRPVYVSAGHRVSLETAVHVIRACSLHRIPEPLRQADLRSRARVAEAVAAVGDG